MRESRGDADLAREALRAESGGNVGMQDFDGDLSLVFRLAREVNDRHSAAADFTLDDEA